MRRRYAVGQPCRPPFQWCRMELLLCESPRRGTAYDLSTLAYAKSTEDAALKTIEKAAHGEAVELNMAASKYAHQRGCYDLPSSMLIPLSGITIIWRPKNNIHNMFKPRKNLRRTPSMRWQLHLIGKPPITHVTWGYTLLPITMRVSPKRMNVCTATHQQRST